jgi:hypothetical protein
MPKAVERPSKHNGAKGLGKLPGYGTLHLAIWESAFQRAVETTVAECNLPDILERADVLCYLNALRRHTN